MAKQPWYCHVTWLMWDKIKMTKSQIVSYEVRILVHRTLCALYAQSQKWYDPDRIYVNSEQTIMRISHYVFLPFYYLLSLGSRPKCAEVQSYFSMICVLCCPEIANCREFSCTTRLAQHSADLLTQTAFNLIHLRREWEKWAKAMKRKNIHEYEWAKLALQLGNDYNAQVVLYSYTDYIEKKRNERKKLGKIHWNNKSCSNRTANKGNEIMLNEKSRVRCWSRLKNTIFYSFECPTKTTAKKIFLRWRSSSVLYSSPKLNKGDVLTAWKCENTKNIATYQHNTRTILT